MKRIGVLLVVAIVFTSCSHQKIITGITSKEQLLTTANKQWFSPNYKNYTLDTTVVKALKKNLKDVSIVVFMGTWCSDSQRHIPAFYKILDEVQFDTKNAMLIAVNTHLKSPEKLHKQYHISKVPTFIFYKNGKELGRIIETPQKSIEADILDIVTRN
ncbi:thioredoxin family protein [Lutibacter sp.]